MARMIARGEMKAKRLETPRRVIGGPLPESLLEELDAVGGRFEETMEDV